MYHKNITTQYSANMMCESNYKHSKIVRSSIFNPIQKASSVIKIAKGALTK